MILRLASNSAILAITLLPSSICNMQPVTRNVFVEKYEKYCSFDKS